MDSKEVVGVPVEVTKERANQTKDELQTLQSNMRDNFIDYSYLLDEFESKKYAQAIGYNSFSEFVEDQLDMSTSKAYYCLKIARKALTLGIAKEALRLAKSSSLIEIFSLDETVHGEAMKNLVDQAKFASVDEIKAAVNALKEKDQLPSKYMTLKVTTEAKTCIDEAIELARKNYGDTLGDGEQPVDISVSKALELICVNYLQDPNNLIGEDSE